MEQIYEKDDILSSPFEAFLFDTNKMDFPVVFHWHYFMEMIFQVEGTARIQCNNISYDLAPNDFILFHPRTIHSICSISSKPLKYKVLKFDINSININSSYIPRMTSIFNHASTDLHAPAFLGKNNFATFPINEIFDGCIFELNAKEYGYDLRFQSLVSLLLVEILRIWKKNGYNINDHKSKISNEESLFDILKYIDKHSHEVLDITQLAAKCHMSYSYFAKRFHELFGQSCKEYIEFIRVSKIKNLLLFTDYDLTYISQEIGFSDCSHLIRTFKKRTGITPKQFRLLQH